LGNRNLQGEGGSAATEDVELFCLKLNYLINKGKVYLPQMYNAGKTKLF
jgi:hypothetical protein